VGEVNFQFIKKDWTIYFIWKSII